MALHAVDEDVQVSPMCREVFDPRFFVFVSPLLGTESQKCVAACSTGTVASWPSRDVL